jgi:pimeloyl-ACP methyl ester carboxylesterase
MDFALQIFIEYLDIVKRLEHLWVKRKFSFLNCSKLSEGKMRFYKNHPITFLFLVLCVSISSNAQSDTAFRYLPPGKLIDIGGWRLHLYGQGTKKESPAVILEAGLGDFSFDWSLVQPEVAKFARVYSYDRAGSAWSDIGPKPHTMQQTVYNLHTLLQKANVPPPYILVGASYGGLLVRLFAQLHPKEVAGIILVDAGFEDNKMFINGKLLQPSIDAKGIPVPGTKNSATQFDNELTPEAKKFIKDILTQQGLPSITIDTPYHKLPASIQQTRLWALSQLNYYAVNDNNYYIEETAMMLRERKKHPFMFDQMPLIVLTRGLQSEQEHNSQQKNMLTLSHNSKQIIAEKSGHHIQFEDPDLVVEAIRQMIEAVKMHKSLNR